MFGYQTLGGACVPSSYQGDYNVKLSNNLGLQITDHTNIAMRVTLFLLYVVVTWL